MKKTKNAWMRLGVSIPLTAEEYDAILADDGRGEEIILQKIRNNEFALDGESYIPAMPSAEQDTVWAFNEEIEFNF